MRGTYLVCYVYSQQSDMSHLFYQNRKVILLNELYFRIFSITVFRDLFWNRNLDLSLTSLILSA